MITQLSIRDVPLALGDSLSDLSAEHNDLFPDHLVDSELGQAPDRWNARALGNVADGTRRSLQPKVIRPRTPYIALEHMPKPCIALSTWDMADNVGNNKLAFNRVEILFGKLTPYFHKVGVTPLDGVCSTDIVVFSPASDD